MFRFLIILVIFSSGPLLAAEKVFDFTETKIGEKPEGFRSVRSGLGPLGDWKILLDDAPAPFESFTTKAPSTSKRRVLGQVSQDPTDERFPLLVYEGDVYGDFAFTTKFKLVAGTNEQMAGVAFRIQDERNYYYIRASGLGNTFYFFKIVDGIRSAPIGVNLEITRGVWHELTVECKGNQIRGFLDGKEAIPPLGDPTFTSGMVGFWTKSDSVTYFAESRILYVKREVLAQALVRDALKKYPRLQGLKIFAVTTNRFAQVIASNDPAEIGMEAAHEVAETIKNGTIYYGKGDQTVSITMPVRDSNGDMAAAARVVMKPFPGQTEKNAITRALPIVKDMEARIRSAQDLIQ